MTETMTKTSTGGTFPNQLNIVVVDDNVINLHLVNTALTRIGQKVDAVRDGAAAVERLRNNGRVIFK